MRKKLLICLLVSIALASPLAVLRRHRSESVESAEVELSTPYLRVVAVLAKKESLEEIVSSGGADLVSRSWEEFKFDLKRIPRISSWEMRGVGRFVVRGNSEDFDGEAEILQRVEVDRSGLVVRSSMVEPCGFVVAHETELSIDNSKRPVLSGRSRIVYERVVPFWMCDEVDRRVAEHNKSHLYAMLRTIKSLVDQ
jgi:hypothetical protein